MISLEYALELIIVSAAFWRIFILLIVLIALLTFLLCDWIFCLGQLHENAFLVLRQLLWDQYSCYCYVVAFAKSCLDSLSGQCYLGPILGPAGNVYLFCAPDRLDFLLASQCRLWDCHPFCAYDILSFLPELRMLPHHEFQVKVTTWPVFALISLSIQRHRPSVLHTCRNPNNLLYPLHQYTSSFTVNTRVFNDQPDTFAPDAFQMHYNGVLSVYGGTWAATCKTSCRRSSRFTLITVTGLAGGFLVIFQNYLGPSYCVQKRQLNGSEDILAFAFFGRSLSVGLMVCAGLILKDVVVELVKWVFVEAVSSASIVIVAARSLVVVLPAFVFIGEDLVGSIWGGKGTVLLIRRGLGPWDQGFCRGDTFGQLHDKPSWFSLWLHFGSRSKFLFVNGYLR